MHVRLLPGLVLSISLVIHCPAIFAKELLNPASPHMQQQQSPQPEHFDRVNTLSPFNQDNPKTTQQQRKYERALRDYRDADQLLKQQYDNLQERRLEQYPRRSNMYNAPAEQNYYDNRVFEAEREYRDAQNDRYWQSVNERYQRQELRRNQQRQFPRF